MKTTVALITTLLSLGPALAEDTHLLGPNSWKQQSVSPTAMNSRIERAANEYKRYAPIPRIGLFDTAYPADSKEYKALDGFAVMLLSVLTQPPEEIPPKRVYAKIGQEVVELKLLSSTFSKVDAAILTAKVFGKNRWDGLYLFPVYLERDAHELLMDFAKNRDDFVLTKFSGKDLNELGNLPIAKPTSKEPDPEALRKIIAREFPGFIEKAMPNNLLQPMSSLTRRRG